MGTGVCRICGNDDPLALLACITIDGVDAYAHEVCIAALPPGSVRLVSWSRTEPATRQFRDQIIATQAVEGAT